MTKFHPHISLPFSLQKKLYQVVAGREKRDTGKGRNMNDLLLIKTQSAWPPDGRLVVDIWWT
jgi:hypothetical protein